MAAAMKRCFLRFLYFTESSPPSFKVQRLQMTMNLALVQVHISSRHSNLNFAHHFVIYWLFQNGANKNLHQEPYKRETVFDKFVFFSKLVRQKKSSKWAKYVYVCEWDMCWRNFCNFSLVTQKCGKSRSKIALFSNERHFEIWFPKKRTITFFWSKLSKLHKKDPIMHVATTFFLKQGETRTSHGPIPHPSNVYTFKSDIHNTYIIPKYPSTSIPSSYPNQQTHPPPLTLCVSLSPAQIA